MMLPNVVGDLYQFNDKLYLILGYYASSFIYAFNDQNTYNLIDKYHFYRNVKSYLNIQLIKLK